MVKFDPDGRLFIEKAINGEMHIFTDIRGVREW
jgi:hypothetical protein